MRLEFYRQFFEKKYKKMKFSVNPSIGSGVGPCG